MHRTSKIQICEAEQCPILELLIAHVGDGLRWYFMSLILPKDLSYALPATESYTNTDLI